MAGDVMGNTSNDSNNYFSSHLTLFMRVLCFIVFLIVGVGFIIFGYPLVSKGIVLLKYPNLSGRGSTYMGHMDPSLALPGVAFLVYGFILACCAFIFLLNNKYFELLGSPNPSADSSAKGKISELYKKVTSWLVNRINNRAAYGILIWVVISNATALSFSIVSVIFIVWISNVYWLTIGVILLIALLALVLWDARRNNQKLITRR